MQDQQHTIQQIVRFEGVGLHTGIKVKGAFLPMPVHTGIQFQRVDLPDQPFIEASIAYVVATERSTTLEKEQVKVATVEHLLAAVAGVKIDNICIQLDGEEVPDLDGSALPFVHLLLAAIPLKQTASRRYFRLKENFSYNDPDTGSYFRVYPDTNYGLHCTLSYNRWPLTHQYATLHTLDQFQKEVASARTFTYLDEITSLYAKGLVQGGDPTKAIILSDRADNKEMLQQITKLSGKTIRNLVTPERSESSVLRYANEPARHKIVDLIGDLVLLGKPLQGQVWAHKPGHGPNIRFVTALKRLLMKQEIKGAPICDLHTKPLFNVEQISKMLPHRYPFQLVDKIIALDDTTIIGVKNVTINEPFFQGHFPGTPVMPGVLQVEALAQTGGILVLNQVANPDRYLTYFLSIDACKFRCIVVPGDTLVLRCQLLSNIKFSTTEKKSIGIAKVKGQVFVGENLACEAVLLAQIVKQNEAI